MALKLGNNDINKAYLGNTEVKKAYLGSNLIFDNSVVIPYYLAFDSVNQDRLQINKSYLGLDSRVADMVLEMRINLINTLVNDTIYSSNNTNRALIAGNGELRIQRGDGTIISIPSFLQTYQDSGWIDFKIVGTTNSIKVFIDEVEIIDDAGQFWQWTASALPYIGASNGDTNLQIESFNFFGDEFELNEGSGFDVTSKNGDVTATGETSNAGGLTYWNSNVWTEASYLLNLGGNTNQDYLYIPQSEKVYQVPATGDFEYGLKFRVPTVKPSGTTGLLGYTRFASVTSRWGVWFDSSGNLRAGGNSSITHDIVSNYGGQIVNVRCGWYDASPTFRIYINDVLITSSNSIARPALLTSNMIMFIGVYGDSTGSLPSTNTYFEGEIYSFFIDDDVFEVNEGSGFPTYSNLGTEATGVTSNAGGLTYWDSNVWYKNI